VGKLVWVRSNHDSHEVILLEQLTGMAVSAPTESAEDWALSLRTAVVLIQLPMAREAVARLIEQAQSAPTPIPVVIYDANSSLDETIIKPLMTPFRHLTEPQTIEQIAQAVLMSRDEARVPGNTPAGREPWCDLLIGESRSIRGLQAMIRLVGPRQSTVLITGESGVGKEVVARSIHMAS
jgi:DNA-binding NtrC family response regulator